MVPVLQVLRPRQWIKNAFVAAPLFFNAPLWSLASWAQVGLAMAAFCLVSSAVYVLNDIVDREADRRHAVKKTRPIASGALSLKAAFWLFPPLLGGGAALSFWAGGGFPLFLLAYAVVQTAYCFWLKHYALIDVMVLAVGFVLRVLGGAALIAVEPTPWIVIMTTLLALFQGLAKRRDDLARALDSDHRRSLQGYNKPFLDASMVVVLGNLLVAYLIFTTDAQAIARFGTDKLFYTAPLVILGVFRYLQITLVEERSGSPTEIVLRDRFMIAAIVGWCLCFLGVTHGIF